MDFDLACNIIFKNPSAVRFNAKLTTLCFIFMKISLSWQLQFIYACHESCLHFNSFYVIEISKKIYILRMSLKYLKKIYILRHIAVLMYTIWIMQMISIYDKRCIIYQFVDASGIPVIITCHASHSHRKRCCQPPVCPITSHLHLQRHCLVIEWRQVW